MKIVELTSGQKQEVLSLYGSGVSGAKVSIKLSLPRRLVYECINEAGVLRQSGNAPINDQTKAKVKELYESGLSTHEIEREIGIGQSTAIKILHEFGITRSIEEGRRIRHEGIYGEKKQKAIELYSAGMGALPVAEKLGVGVEAVTQWLKDAGLHIRGRSESMKKYHEENRTSGESHPMYGKTHTPESRKKISEAKGGKVTVHCKFCGKAKEIPPSRVKEDGNYCNYKCRSAWLSQNQRGEDNPNWKGKTITMFCSFCGESVVKEEWAVKDREKVFCNNICHGNYKSEYEVGKNNANYVDGRSYGDYCHKFNDNLKERVRWFFADSNGVRRCFLCGEAEPETGARLPVHHVDYDKSTCCNGKTPYLVPLCQKCHNKTSGKHVRKQYEEEIKKKLLEQTGGKCFFTKEEFCQFVEEHPEYFCV